MSGIAVRDTDQRGWSSGRFIEEHEDYTVMRDGFWHADLKLPISADLTTCLASHGIYAKPRYEKLHASGEFARALGGSLPELSDGILHTGSASHYHYLIDGIGNLSRGLLGRSSRVFVDQAYSDDQVMFLHEALNVIGGKSFTIERIKPGIYRTKNVVVARKREFHLRAGMIRDTFVRPPAEQVRRKERFFVSRRNAQTRRLVNEQEIIERLQAEHGFVLLDNEKNSLAQQVQVYADAEFIVGPHGAGLTNIVFAQRPRGLLEFWHSVRQPFFERLSEAVGVSYLGVAGTPSPDGEPLRRADDRPFEMDPNTAVRAVDFLLKNARTG